VGSATRLTPRRRPRRVGAEARIQRRFSGGKKREAPHHRAPRLASESRGVDPSTRSCDRARPRHHTRADGTVFRGSIAAFQPGPRPSPGWSPDCSVLPPHPSFRQGWRDRRMRKSPGRGAAVSGRNPKIPLLRP
jgi:hypothetical protein